LKLPGSTHATHLSIRQAGFLAIPGDKEHMRASCRNLVMQGI